MAQNINNPRQELLALQKSLNLKIKADIRDYTGEPTEYFRHYRKEYLDGLKSYEVVSSYEMLTEAIKKHQIVYCGDYHTLRQAQRSVIRLFRKLVHEQRPIILGLEMVSVEDQEHLDAYLIGKLPERHFLEKVRYQEAWDFEWQNYKQLFDFARKHGVGIKALNCNIRKGDQILQKRDRVAADTIVNLHKEFPNSLIFVLYGDLHIAEQHIPQLVKENLQQQDIQGAVQLIIYQNSEYLYWLLSEQGIEHHTDVVKLDDHRYCILNTPPWVKEQSYLNWLEHRRRRSEDEIYEDEFGDLEDEYDYQGRMWDMVDTIASFLKLDKKQLGSFHIFSGGDLEFLSMLYQAMKSPKFNAPFYAELLRAEIIYNGTCLLPKENLIYLANATGNRIAEKLALWMHLQYAGSLLVPDKKKSHLQLYFGKILEQIIAFFGSKIINYRRKCENWHDFEMRARELDGLELSGRLREQRTMSQLLLLHRDLEETYLRTGEISRNWQRLYNQPAKLFFGVTQIVGAMVAERIYEAIMNSQVDRHLMTDLLQKPIKATTDNRKRYFKIIETLFELT